MNDKSKLRKISMITYILIFTSIFGYYVFSKNIFFWGIYTIAGGICSAIRLKNFLQKERWIIILSDTIVIFLMLIVGRYNLPYKSVIFVVIISLYLNYYFKKYIYN